jgi:hypothetical protein
MVLIFIMLVNFTLHAQNRKKTAAKVNTKNAVKYELNIHFTPALTDLHSKKFGSEETSQFGYIGGFDFCYYFHKYSKSTMGIDIGLNYSNYKTRRNLNYNDTFPSTDIDNENILINEKAIISESQNISFLEIPLLLKTNYMLSANTSVYFNIGPDFMVPIKKTYQSSGPVTRTLYYPKYNATIDSVYDPVFYLPKNMPVSYKGTLKVGAGLSLITGIGIKQKLNFRYSVFGGINIAYGIVNMNGYSGNAPFVIAPSFGTYNSLMGRRDKISNLAYGVQFGISVNLGKKPAEKSTGKSTDKSVIAPAKK